MGGIWRRYGLLALVLLVWGCDDGGDVASGGSADTGRNVEDGQDGEPLPDPDATLPPTPDAGRDADVRPPADAGRDAAPGDDAEPPADARVSPDADRTKDVGPDGAADCEGDDACPPGRWCAEDGDCREGCRLDPDDCPDGFRCGPDRVCVPDGACLPDERCGNLADDDCDGRVDEGFPELGQPCEDGLGVCAGVGTWTCGPDGALACDRGPSPAGPERCDGLDNDCDGAVDEDYPQLGERCAGGEGVCAAEGRWRCVGGDAVCDAQPGVGEAELCDGLDNDCDGRTDETFPGLGAPCSAGLAACRREGATVCAGDGGGTRCDALPGEPQPEECNGLDDDCDGRIDEDEGGQPLTEACFDGPPGTRGVGPCRGGTRLCVGGRWSACEGQVLPAEEVCNNRDDDCDGSIDATGGEPLSVACYTGPAGTEGVGACQPGRSICRLGRFTACEDEGRPSPEICDEEDNDCNGQVDDGIAGGCECAPGEQRPCYNGPAGTAGVGACRAGLQDCRPDGRGWGACIDARLPRAEVCNGVDDDCDGEVDDDLGVGEPCGGGAGACGGEGVIVCDAVGLRCEVIGGGPQPEQCNDEDDDCDGRTDEGFPVGERCVRGVGACARGAIAVCGEDGDLRCPAVLADPTPEVCDNVDNDCDGATDEGFGVNEECFAGRGVCARAGVLRCDGRGGTFCTAQPGAPQGPEQCNGLDDDCDGRVDEGFNLGAPCETGVGACRAEGRLVCADGGGTTCDAEPGAPGPETCDGEDDDCDGRTDEGLFDLGACQSGAPGVCGPGRLICAVGQQACVPVAVPTVEACDRVDNDCDGEIDEDLGTFVCGEGVCRRRLPTCVGGARPACDPLLGAQDVELCNGLDDDCDGEVDEDAVGAGAPCGAGVGGCQRAGQARCVEGVFICDAVPGSPVEERCNALDDDCDGRVDENTIESRTTCFAGEGLCRGQGRFVCEGGIARCDAQPVPGSVEICDGLDNDCDGELDEGFGSAVCGIGACRHAVPRCDGGEAPGCDPMEGASPETCNGIDDDCDGRTDEGELPGVGASCAAGQGACRREGVTVCQGGAVVCGVQAGAPEPERCDGLDNDCDGLTDEQPVDANVACTTGVGECARQGTRICVGGRLSCTAVAGPPRGEMCDGLDNDCDGTSDEALGTVVCGRGLCRQQLPACADGVPSACDPFAGAEVERCNGQDDDCDGVIDEDPSDAGAPCSAGQGTCRRDGSQICVDGRLTCSAVAGAPRVEACDGLDDDCDRRVDEDFGIGEPCFAGIGACRAAGAIACNEGGDGIVCAAPVGEPGAEVCDGRDNDCDARVDENLDDRSPCDTGRQGICAVGARRCQLGVESCTQTIQPVPEICNGLDDDCDGTVDEGLGEVACGVGQCRRQIPRCTDGAPTLCDATAGAQPEQCNGVDDDCDGRTDEEAAGVRDPCSAGEGGCVRPGLVRCVNAALVCDAIAGAPQPELCNLVDDDCDGIVDEDPQDARATCAAGEGGCRREAQLRCVNGALECPAVPGAPGVEACNGVDDDCDGTLDEGFGSVVCGVGACRHAVPSCDGGAPPQCDPMEGASPEICNGIDDDCDGVTDEGVVAGVGEPCAAGAGICRRDGATVCAGGRITCGAQLGAPMPERCNALDDDCDGIIDEDAALVGDACSAGTGACQRDGVNQCVGGRLTCNAVPGAGVPETCNGQDDDCDGVTDEHLGTAFCGQGICRRIVAACVNGGPAPCDPFAGAQLETCNGADDDCDGRVDEDLGTLRCGIGGCDHEVPSCLGGAPNACDPSQGARAEVCNGVDDDCDGRVDEQPTDVGRVCTGGLGDCRAVGSTVCTNGQLTCSAPVGQPTAERCDNADNDCDGRTDEGTPGSGQPCELGLGACAAVGVTDCREGIVTCVAQPGDPADEVLCTGADEDCDGLVDEGQPDCDGNGTHDQCDLQAGVPDCNQNGVPDRCDIAGATSRDCNANGIPDECNGDGADCPPDVTPPVVDLFVGGAVVNPGTRVQVVVQAQDDEGVVELGLTVNGEEVPLDGAGQAFVTLDAPGVYRFVGRAEDFAGNVGTAEHLVRVLDPNDVEAPTVAITTPPNGAILNRVTEVRGTATDPNLVRWALTWGTVNQPDQHLLGESDQPIVNGLLGVLDPARIPVGRHGLQLRAEDVNGRASILRGEFTIADCEPVDERCNYGDDDCDGRIDETFPDLQTQCFNGVGACRREGVRLCAAGGGGTVCAAEPGAPSPERCDAIDHDCDGNPTNGFAVGQRCTVGVGLCAREGLTVCNGSGDGVTCNAQPGAPAVEICNGRDDDCDGEADEGFERVTCGVGACRHTVSECEDGMPGGPIVCDPFEGAAPEMCNGVDDDCDGRTDEDARDVGGPCGQGEGACFREGVTVCRDGEITCGAEPGAPQPEVCNDLDDDCDGPVDEGFVCPDRVPPTVRVVLSRNVINAGEQITITVVADDDRGVAQVALTVGGAPVPLDGNRQAVYTAGDPGLYAVVGIARDAAGNEGSGAADLFVLDPGDVRAPVVSIALPTADTVLTEDFVVTGSVDDQDDNLFEYRLSYAPMTADTWVDFARGRNEVQNGPLGTFRPTLLENGMYRIRLQGEDINGRIGQAFVVVRVQGEAKVGNYRMTFVDASVAVAGVPLVVHRTYDSRVKTKRDFGVAWTLDVKAGKVEHNRPPHEDWEVRPGFFGLPCLNAVETAPHLTEVRLSDRELYTFQQQIYAPAALLGGCQVRVRFAFVASTVPGTAQLQILDSDIAYYLNGTNELVADDFFTEFDVRRVRLITPDRREVDLHKVNGAFRLADTVGNEVQIASNGLSHSAGRNIQFIRDGQGRITELRAPGGATVRYGYDQRGDLVTVTDPEGNVTRFTYDGAHNLLEVRDPLGRVPTRQEFDDDGRLIAVIDALGNRQEFDHDLGDRIEVVTDKRGHATTMQYDARGNVVREVGKRGGITTRTFDAANRKLTETDPQSRTTTFTYDAQGRLIRTTYADGSFKTQTWDARNNLLTETDRDGGVTTHTYDANNRKLSTTDPEGNTTTWTYDARGNRITQTDAEGNITRWTYNDLGAVATETDPMGTVRRYDYSAAGHRLSESVTWTDGDGNAQELVTRFEYDRNGEMVRRIDPLGGVTTYAYDAAGNKVREVDAIGRVKTWTYDGFDRVIRETLPNGVSRVFQYDAEGNKTLETDPDGYTTRFEHDADGRITRLLRPDGDEVLREYDSRGSMVRQTDENGHVSHFEYDALGNKVLERDALGRETRYFYDGRGNVVREVRPDGTEVLREYDGIGKQTRVSWPDGTEETWTYDGLGNMLTWTDAAGHTTAYAYDALSRLVEVTDAEGGVTSYEYDELGNRTAVTDANGHTTRFVYDGLGRQISRVLPMGQTEHKVYDAASRMTSHQDFDGTVTTFTYDALDNLVRRDTAGEGVETAERSAGGRRLSYTDPRGRETWTYDPAGRIATHETADGDVLRLTYDGVGNLIGRSSPAGDDTFEYDAANRLVRVTDDTGAETEYTYNLMGSLETVTLPNGVTTTYTYDERQRLTDVETVTGAGQLVASYHYTLGPVGNRTRVVEGHRNRQVDYTYDRLYRLTRERITENGQVVRTIDYTYDAVGNRLRKTDSVDGITNYSYDDNDQLVQEGPLTHAYNPRGDLIETRGPGAAIDLTWDARRRLVQVDTAGVSIEYVYDMDDHRVQRIVNGVNQTKYLYDATRYVAQLLRVTDTQGDEIARFVHGDELIAQHRDGAVHYYGYDGQLSTRYLTSAAGAAAATYDYDAFGNLLRQTGNVANEHRYGGEYTDAHTGFINLRARWLNPRIGRFMSHDPAEGTPFDPPSLHRYTYADNDPVLNADPTGNFSLVGISFSLSIGGQIRSIYTANLIKTFLKVNRIAQCGLKPGADMRNRGIDLLASGIWTGAELAQQGQQVMAGAFKAIANAILEFYQNVGNALTTIKLTGSKEIDGLGKLSGSVSVNGSGGFNWTGLKFSWQKYIDQAISVTEAIIKDAENPDCSGANTLEALGNILVGYLPKF